MAQDEKRVGPIRFTAAGQEFTESCRIVAVIWVGTVTAADVAELRGLGASTIDVLWRAQASAANTFLDTVFGLPGVHAPDGFRAAILPAGELLVYLAE